MDKEARKAVEKFLIAWQKKDWKKMKKYTQLTWRSLHLNNVMLLESWFEYKDLKKWEIIKTEFVGDACRDVSINIDYGEGIKRIKARVLCEDEPYKPNIKGTWGVNPISCLKEN